MYVDDLILLLSSKCELQSTLDICCEFAVDNALIFNAESPFVLLRVKIKVTLLICIVIVKLFIGLFSLNILVFILFLVVSLVDIAPVRRNFYVACNSVIGRC